MRTRRKYTWKDYVQIAAFLLFCTGLIYLMLAGFKLGWRIILNGIEREDFNRRTIQMQQDIKDLKEQFKEMDKQIDQLQGTRKFSLETGLPLDMAISVDEASKRVDVDRELLAGLVKVESSGNARAVSSAGAMGATQLMPSTAKWVFGQLGIRYDSETVFDPTYNILGGAWYLKQLLDETKGDTHVALISYNMGPGGAQEYISRNNIKVSRYSQNVVEYRNQIKERMARRKQI